MARDQYATTVRADISPNSPKGRHFNKGNSICANDMLAKNPKVFQVQELPKTALWSCKRPFSRHASETAKWLGSLAWNCPTTRPKNHAPNNPWCFPSDQRS